MMNQSSASFFSYSIPWVPPITKTPLGFRWNTVLSLSRFDGITSGISFVWRSLRISCWVAHAACCVDTTTVCTRCGMHTPFTSLKSTVTLIIKILLGKYLVTFPSTQTVYLCLGVRMRSFEFSSVALLRSGRAPVAVWATCTAPFHRLHSQT